MAIIKQEVQAMHSGWIKKISSKNLVNQGEFKTKVGYLEDTPKN